MLLFFLVEAVEVDDVVEDDVLLVLDPVEVVKDVLVDDV